jgi:E1A/CREB-binding protein
MYSVGTIAMEKQNSGISSCKTSPPYGLSDHTSSDSDPESESVCKDESVVSKASFDDQFMDDINDAETDKESHTKSDDHTIDTVASGYRPDNIDCHGHWKASSLPRSNLSDFMEAMVTAKLAEMGHAAVAASITIRLTSNLTQHMEVPDSIFMNMMTASGLTIPQYLSYKQKCILLFQNINGVDVCLFCLYVHEFDDKCPEPNNSVVYIAYLDSVDYFRPMEARSAVYHEILVAYLKWVQARGFKQGHIWSCPPQRGDNFIFWNHPPHQKTPSRDRLNS